MVCYISKTWVSYAARGRAVQCHSTIERGITFTAQGSSYVVLHRNTFLLCPAAKIYIGDIEQCIVPYMGSLVLYSKAGKLRSSAKLEGESRKKRLSPL